MCVYLVVAGTADPATELIQLHAPTKLRSLTGGIGLCWMLMPVVQHRALSGGRQCVLQALSPGSLPPAHPYHPKHPSLPAGHLHLSVYCGPSATLLCARPATQTTLTTTGYGDLVPITYQGKFVAGILMLFALITLALPISVIGANFTNMWTDYKTMKRAAERSAQVRLAAPLFPWLGTGTLHSAFVDAACGMSTTGGRRATMSRAGCAWASVPPAARSQHCTHRLKPTNAQRTL